MARKTKYTLEFIRNFMAAEGYKIIGSVEGPHKPFLSLCPEGHQCNIRFYGFYKRGYRCFECRGSKKYDYSYVKQFFEKEGYVLISTEYKRSKGKLKTLCPEGHIYEVSFSKFKDRGFRCSTCSGKSGLNISVAKERFKERGYTLIDTTYVDAITPLKFKCDNNHIHKMSINNLKKGQRCGLCFNEFECGRSSRAEKEIGKFLQTLGVDYIENDRDVINPYELDFYIPSKKVAIEYCGLYWHSDMSGKPRRYHYDKMVGCRDKGIRLITIFEDEYLEHPEVVLSRIKSSLGMVDMRIFGRKCVVKQISKKEAKEFLIKHHLQGYSPCKFSFGLFYKGLLHGVITGGIPSRNHAGGEGTIELKRLAFSSGVSVVGGASKLFKHFIDFCKKNNYNKVKSYCDMRWAKYDSTVYEKLGFHLVSETKYTPHYFKGQKRYRNQSLAKTKEERKTGKTEWELRQEQGFKRIWDCGHRTYVFTIVGELNV